MLTFMRLLLACTSLAAAALAVAAQTQTASQQGDQKVVVNAGEVALDLVVRDKKGRALTDLRASDFEVYEDGLPQQVDSFRLVAREDGGGVGGVRAGGNPGAADSSGNGVGSQRNTGAADGPRLSAVALVFDRLSPDARARARQAALAYLGEKGDLVGVFLTDLSLVVLQPYTDDMQLVRDAIEKAGASASSLYTSNNEQTRDVRKRLVDITEEQARNPACCGDIKKRLEMTLWRLETDEEFQRDQQGTATMSGLLKVAASLRGLPGRKAVIFFSEGLSIPPSVVGPFRALVNAANRNNVSFYTVDAAGLRAESKTEETRKEIVSRSALRQVQEANNKESDAPMTKGLERNEDLLNLNPDSGLGQLADQTGGAYITETNDLKARLQKVDEDLHTYYLLSYSPKNRNYDGSYRKIEVKVRRPGAVVQSRKGYFAINGAYASPVLSYEVPALALLGRGERPDSFRLAAAGFNFPEPGRGGLAPFVVEGRMADFSFQVDDSKKLYRTDFSIVVLLKDQSGQVVRKMSNQYRLSGPLEQLEAAKRGRVLFYREAELPAGRYSFEAVAYDAPTGRASVRAGTLEVPEASEGGTRLSSLVIVGSAETATADQKADNPFRVGDLLVYPNTGEAAHKETSKQLPFFFTLYVPPGLKTSPKLSIELRQGETSLARIPAELPAPDAAGRIQYLAALPLEKIQPGAYELRVTVEDGKTTLSRTASFTVEK
jgi:VWFA-related protein